ncbi:MAG: hypothetical protein RL095_213 [Verrucomicrobiota bacterium]|jgi:myo-inositol-1(or 4)-monophosphatase
MPKNFLQQRLVFLRDLAAEAASLALLHARKGTQNWDKSDGSPVTEADLALDQLIRQRISIRYPGEALLTEEGKDDASRLDQDWVWIVDPIDGTKEFIAGTPEYSVMIGLSHEGVAVAGAVAIPGTGEIFSGADGHGVSVERPGSPPFSLRHPLPGPPRLLVSRTNRDQRVIDLSGALGFEALPCGSVGTKICRLIDGSARAYATRTTVSEWDCCAADALMRACGGRLLDGAGRERLYNQTDVSVPGIIASFDGETAKACLDFLQR